MKFIRITAITLTALAVISLAACAPAATPAPAATSTRPPATAAPAAAPTTAAAPSATPALAATTPASAPPTAAPAPAATAMPTATAAQKLNLNTTSQNDFLKGIPGFGPNMLREFLEYRPWTSITQFRREIGKYVDAKQVAEYEKFVYVPIDINKADAATLQQFPGLDASEAAALIAARPYANADVFIARVTPMVSAAELALGRAYLAP